MGSCRKIILTSHVRKIRKTDSENKNEGKSRERKGQEQVLEELDDTPVVNVNHELLRGDKELIRVFKIQNVKAALAVAERDI